MMYHCIYHCMHMCMCMYMCIMCMCMCMYCARFQCGASNATLRVLLESGLHYQRTCGHNVGMLSNALCRYGAFNEQADARAPWTAVIEDDAALSTHFMQYIGGLAGALRGSEEHNTTIVQLGAFGEGYLTSLGTAKAIVRRFKERGIRDCPEPAYNGGRLLGQGTFKVHQHNHVEGDGRGQPGRPRQDQTATRWALRDASQCGDSHARALSCIFTTPSIV